MLSPSSFVLWAETSLFWSLPWLWLFLLFPKIILTAHYIVCIWWGVGREREGKRERERERGYIISTSFSKITNWTWGIREDAEIVIELWSTQRHLVGHFSMQDAISHIHMKSSPLRNVDLNFVPGSCKWNATSLAAQARSSVLSLSLTLNPTT